MDQESLVIGLMLAAPAVIGLFALIASVVLFGTAKQEDGYRTLKLIAGVFMLIVALGIGACYGVLLFGGLGAF